MLFGVKLTELQTKLIRVLCAMKKKNEKNSADISILLQWPSVGTINSRHILDTPGTFPKFSIIGDGTQDK